MASFLVTPTNDAMQTYYEKLINSEYGDICIKCTDGEIRAISALLLIASEYFKLAQRQENICRTKLTRGQMLIVIRYIYTQYIETPSIEDAKDIIIEARIMLLDGLAKHYEDFLTANINMENIIDLISYSHSNKLEWLENKCVDFICNSSPLGSLSCFDLVGDNPYRFCCLHDFKKGKSLGGSSYCIRNPVGADYKTTDYIRTYCCAHKNGGKLASFKNIFSEDQLANLPRKILCKIVSRMTLAK